jgi:hypothetical protein
MKLLCVPYWKVWKDVRCSPLVCMYSYASSLIRNIDLSTYLSVCLSIYLWLNSPLLRFGRFFSLWIFYTVGRSPWTGDQPIAMLLLHTGQHKHRLNRTEYSQDYLKRIGPQITKVYKYLSLSIRYGTCKCEL